MRRRTIAPTPEWRQLGDGDGRFATWEFHWPGSRDHILVRTAGLVPSGRSISRVEAELLLRGMKRIAAGRHPGTGKPLTPA